jgi:hypothetical protein
MRLFTAVLIVCLGAADGTSVQSPRVPVLLELFTSEGCSSCPPADDLLRRLVQEQPVAGVEIIGLSEHVDYWNQQGWRDPFSSSRYTSRQERYVPHFDGNGMYTPQAVVDGRFQMNGSDAPKLRDAILSAAKSPKATVHVLAHKGAGDRVDVTVDVRDVPLNERGDIDVMLALVENGLAVDVKRGENAHRRLQHDAVARTLERIGTLARDARDGVFKAEPKTASGWSRGNLRVVVFLQHRRSAHVLGAAAAAID